MKVLSWKCLRKHFQLSFYHKDEVKYICASLPDLHSSFCVSLCVFHGLVLVYAAPAAMIFLRGRKFSHLRSNAMHVELVSEVSLEWLSQGHIWWSDLHAFCRQIIVEFKFCWSFYCFQIFCWVCYWLCNNFCKKIYICQREIYITCIHLCIQVNLDEFLF